MPLHPSTRLLAQAVALLKAGRPEAAIAPLREAASLQPDNAILQHDLGLACLEANRPAEAADALRCAVASNPRYTDAHFRLGVALEKLGDSGGAILAYDRATELLPSHTEAWFRAGVLVYLLGHIEEAVGCFRRAAASGPKTSFGRLGAARALLAEDRDAQAEKILRQTLALDPQNAIALDLLANVLADAGRFEEARDYFLRAIAASPLMAGSYYDLVRCRRVTREDAYLLDRMQAALDTPGLNAAQLFRIHLAIGKAADDFGDPALAMHHFDTADKLRSAETSFDPAAFDTQIDRLIALFTPDSFIRVAAAGSYDETPVLILGMPRSGTTLVEQIVSGHPNVAAGGELNFWGDRGAAWAASGTAEIDASFLGEASAAYLALLRSIGPKAARITDKMPFNFLWAGLIHMAFPRATIIHCRRAAIDTALSIHQTHFNPSLAFPTGGPALVAYFRSYTRLTDHWRRVLPAQRFVDVDYAQLTRAPEAQIRRMIEACGLDWDEACLHPEQNTRLVKTPSKWQARQKINQHSVERWRRYEGFLGPLEDLKEGLLF